MSRFVIHILGAAVIGSSLIVGANIANAARTNFDGIWVGKTNCQHAHSHAVNNLTKKIILTVTGDKANLKSPGKGSYKIYPGSGVLEQDGNISSVTIHGDTENVRGGEGQYKVVGTFTRGSNKMKLEGEFGSFTECEFTLVLKGSGKNKGSSSKKNVGLAATSSGLVTATSIDPDNLKGIWTGNMSCGEKNSYVDNPKKPFNGDVSYTREVKLRIGIGGEILMMRGATIMGAPVLELASGTVGSDGKISVEGSFVSKRNGKTFTYKFNGATDGKSISLWGQFDRANRVNRGCKAEYTR